ncbi:MAG: sigma-E processing peptidase SpoIIGA [Lachnospiraceae bacterium]|nr:sigma-E processing peptidase SpoIIGA [Lachnospiraceae bacterium]
MPDDGICSEGERWAYIYELYVDTLFLINGIMDFLALYLVDTFFQYRTKKIRLLLGAGAGSLLGVLLFLVMSDYTMYQLCIHLLINPLMIRLAYAGCGKWKWLKNYLACYVCMVLCGGMMQWLYHTLFHTTHLYMAVMLTAGGCVLIVQIWRRRRRIRSQLYPVILKAGDFQVRFDAYYDTGNLMMDPYIGKPVSVLDESVLPADVRAKLAFRLIPYESLGNREGMLEAFTADSLMILCGKEPRCISPAVIGLTEKKLFAHREYRMILNHDLM